MTKKKPEFDSNFFIPPWLDLKNNLSKKNSETGNEAVEELEKKIRDLKSVEQWLNLNLSILLSTIQGLELQKNTISSLSSTTRSKKNNTKTSKKPTNCATNEFTETIANSNLLWWKSVEDQMEAILKANTDTKLRKKSLAKKKNKSRMQRQTKASKKMV